MQEEADRGVRQPFAQKPGQQHQVEVVHPDGVTLLPHLDDRVAESLIGALICLP